MCPFVMSFFLRDCLLHLILDHPWIFLSPDSMHIIGTCAGCSQSRDVQSSNTDHWLGHHDLRQRQILKERDFSANKVEGTCFLLKRKPLLIVGLVLYSDSVMTWGPYLYSTVSNTEGVFRCAPAACHVEPLSARLCAVAAGRLWAVGRHQCSREGEAGCGEGGLPESH